MAHHKSAVKRIKTTERNQLRNKFNVSTMRTYMKAVLTAKEKKEGIEKYNTAASIIDKLVKKGVLHKNTAANRKSQLMKHVNTLN
jgi:small subunit ribosomal protein S20